MLEYVDVLQNDNWMQQILICPFCLSKLYKTKHYLRCYICSRRYEILNGIPCFEQLPFDKREYLFEMNRYKNIALKPPETYFGFDDSYPIERAEILKKYLKNKNMYLNIGQGFGQLEQTMPSKAKICLDQCIEFLNYCNKKEIPNTRYVMGFAEKMPFKSKYFPAVVSDSVFQTLVDQREFLVENARVLKNEGIFLLTITYKWNYPRKPQSFMADIPELLVHFLKELEINAEYEYLTLPNLDKSSYEEGDILIVKGVKQ